MKDIYSRVTLGIIACSLLALVIQNSDIIQRADAVVKTVPTSTTFVVEKNDGHKGFLGEVRLFAGDYAPLGWAFCDGTELEIEEYEDLYTIIGDTYGGNGEETFALPDLRNRTAVGVGKGERISEVDLGEGRIYVSTLVQSNQQTALKNNPGQLKKDVSGNKFSAKSSRGDSNIRTRTADLGLNYIICVKGTMLLED